MYEVCGRHLTRVQPSTSAKVQGVLTSAFKKSQVSVLCQSHSYVHCHIGSNLSGKYMCTSFPLLATV